MVVLFLYTIVVWVEFIIDRNTLQDPNRFNLKNIRILLIPFIIQDIVIFLLTLIAIVYFITAYCCGQNKCVYKFDTVLITLWLITTALTIPLSPIYIVCFFVAVKELQVIEEEFPMLFILLILMQILSFFDFIFCAWILMFVCIQNICFKVGLKQRNSDLMFPMELQNDNKRDVEIQEASESYSPDNEQINGEFSSYVQ